MVLLLWCYVRAMTTIAGRIRHLRETHEPRLSQEALARAVGVSVNAVRKWERGDSEPNAANVIGLARALHTDPNTLLGWETVRP